MNGHEVSDLAASTTLLWQHLVSELSDVFDAHGVCAAVAQAIAIHADTITLVALSDPLRRHYDVWICEGGHQIVQTRWEDHRASFDALFEDGRAVVRDRFAVPASELVRSELWQLPKESILAVPLPFPANNSGLTPPGAICLIDPSVEGPVNLETIELVAAQLTIFLDRAFLRQRSDQQSVEFGIVSDISYSFTSTLNLEEIFQQVADAVRRALGAESISIGLTDTTSDEVVFVEALMGPLFRNLPPIRLKMGQGIAGWVAMHGEPTIVNDAYSDNRFFATVDRESGFQTNSILCVPLQVEQRVIGVLEAINKRNGHFDQNDLRLLQAIGGPLAVAIENARLHADVLAEKRRIESIFASMSEGLLTANGAGVITAANDALLALLQKQGDEVYGHQLQDVIHTRNANFDDFVGRVIEAAEDYPQMACDLGRRNAESVPILVSGTTIRANDGEVDEFIFVFSDLSQVREVERMRDDFFHNIIHELRTPLATILMYARLLREGKTRQDEVKSDRFLGVIERESDRLQKMVRQMLLLAKLEAREFQRSSESVKLNPIFEQILPPLADRATEKGLTFSQSIGSELPAVLGNEDTLYMIFKNLIENSIKFTPSGSVRVNASLENGQVRVVVADEGIGIPKQALPNLFKRFYRAQTAVERGIAGTGLGLYMVREGVEKHGGTIDVESTEGEGTTFTVRLPVAA